MVPQLKLGANSGRLKTGQGIRQAAHQSDPHSCIANTNSQLGGEMNARIARRCFAATVAWKVLFQRCEMVERSHLVRVIDAGLSSGERCQM